MNLSILYRGPLSSCNYGCHYCPFAKRVEGAAELARDRRALERFVAWVADHPQFHISVLFTPWGEALIRPWYQRALIQLSHLSNVEKAAVQTNLSGRLDWTEQCDKERVALWATFHPSETTRARFVTQCQELDRRGLRYSVGVVGLNEHGEEIEALRQSLATGVYLWINAYKREPDYYDEAMVERFARIDSLFPVNNQYHPSLGRKCRTGHSVIAVDGAGTIRRCHFVREPLGNLYEPGFEQGLMERPCPNQTCGCHIGYAHLEELNLLQVFGSGLLERIPANPADESPKPSPLLSAFNESRSGRDG